MPQSHPNGRASPRGRSSSAPTTVAGSPPPPHFRLRTPRTPVFGDGASPNVPPPPAGPAVCPSTPLLARRRQPRSSAWLAPRTGPGVEARHGQAASECGRGRVNGEHRGLRRRSLLDLTGAGRPAPRRAHVRGRRDPSGQPGQGGVASRVYGGRNGVLDSWSPLTGRERQGPHATPRHTHTDLSRRLAPPSPLAARSAPDTPAHLVKGRRTPGH